MPSVYNYINTTSDPITIGSITIDGLAELQTTTKHDDIIAKRGLGIDVYENGVRIEPKYAIVNPDTGELANANPVSVGNIFSGDTTVTPTSQDIGVVGYKAAPSFIKSIGVSNAVAAAVEAFSDALPKNNRVNTPITVEQGVIRLDARVYTLEKPIVIDLSSAAHSRFGLTIEGVGSSQSTLYIPGTAQPATFRDPFGDGIWRAIRLKSNDTGKLNEVKFRGFRVLSYAKQNGDNTTHLQDPCRWVDFENTLQLQLNDVLVYQRTLRDMSLDQYGFSFKNCYYSSLDNLQVVGHLASGTGLTINGSVKNRKAGVGFRLENTNAGVLKNPMALGVNLGFHLINEDGLLILGGATESHNASFFFDGDSSGNKVVHHRGEWNQLANVSPMEPGNMYFAKFGENTYNNMCELTSEAISLGPIKIDNSISQSNVVRGSETLPKYPKNMLAGATWANSGGVSSVSSTVVPIPAAVSTSTAITSDGNFNRTRYSSAVKINKGCGSVRAETWLKKISGHGLIIPQIAAAPASGNTRIYGGALAVSNSLTLSNVFNASMRISSLTWSANRLTLQFIHQHYMQPGMTVRSDTGWGSIAVDTTFIVESVLSETSLVLRALGASGDITDPGATTATTVKMLSDMSYFLNVPNISDDWQRLETKVNTRRYVTSYSTDGSNIVTLSLNSALTSTTGVIVNLYNFSDSRLNTSYTIQAGNISGNSITLTALGGLPGLSLTNKAVGSGVFNYGWVELDSVYLDFRTVSTNSGQSVVTAYAGEALYVE